MDVVSKHVEVVLAEVIVGPGAMQALIGGLAGEDKGLHGRMSDKAIWLVILERENLEELAEVPIVLERIGDVLFALGEIDKETAIDGATFQLCDTRVHLAGDVVPVVVAQARWNLSALHCVTVSQHGLVRCIANLALRIKRVPSVAPARAVPMTPRVPAASRTQMHTCSPALPGSP